VVLLTIVKVPFAVKCCTVALALAVAVVWAWAVVVATATAVAAFLAAEYSSHANTLPPISIRMRRTPKMILMRLPRCWGEGGGGVGGTML
jgi:hypothetical protein